MGLSRIRFLKFIAEDVGREKLGDVLAADWRYAGNDEAVIRDLKAQRLQAQMLHAPRDQHAERLVRAAAREGVEHGAVEALLKKVLHQQPVAIGNG